MGCRICGRAETGESGYCQYCADVYAWETISLEDYIENPADYIENSEEEE